MSFDQINSIATSGMAAQRLRVQLIASNIANSETTRTAEGGPFKRKDAVFRVASMGKTIDGNDATGVQVGEITTSKEPFISRYDPTHPDANAEGVVLYPNVNPVEEMVNLTEASRSFEANVAVVRAARSMALSAMDILRVQ
ncbi:MAG TPA: flagellar basal body rod protein FlgC [Holophaga sp.]|jgi:flagellar basal-body rod protein FlgC|nr:flagellar basal body rod protein FlgC [Holophaga sp.]